MKKSIVTAFLVFICFLLQTSVCHWFSFGGIVPNLLILLTAASGFMNGEKAGMWTGFACGLLADLFSANGGGAGNTGDMLGFYALLYLLIGYCNGKCNRLFYPEDLKFPLLMITASDLVFNFICYGVMFFFRARLDILYYLLHIIIPEAVYTIVIAFVFYPLLLLINRRLERSERKSEDQIAQKD